MSHYNQQQQQHPPLSYPAPPSQVSYVSAPPPMGYPPNNVAFGNPQHGATPGFWERCFRVICCGYHIYECCEVDILDCC